MNSPTRRLAVLALIAVTAPVVSLPFISTPVGAQDATCRVFVANADMTIAVDCPMPVLGSIVPPPPATTGVRAVRKARVNLDLIAVRKPVRDPQLCHNELERTQLGTSTADDVSSVREACKK